MSFFTIFLLALALSADAASVALAVGLQHRAARQRFRLSFHFGLFQALMPLLGASGGLLLQRFVGDVDHFLAFGILELIGLRMVWDAWRGDPESPRRQDPTRGLSLLVLSLATSIDAFGAGIGLGLAQANVLLSCLVIGCTTGLLTWGGMHLGARAQRLIGNRATLLGGVILMALGVKMLWI